MGEHRRGVFVAPVDELEEEDGAASGDREVADLVDDQECRVGQGLEALVEASRGLGLLERVDQVGQGDTGLDGGRDDVGESHGDAGAGSPRRHP